MEYFIPTQQAAAEYVEKKSRFIGHVWRVTSEEEAKNRIEETRKRHYDARHNCWCYIIRDGQTRYSDDGEPQGTAGQPMLNVFQRSNIENVCCVVTRYFGGVLLGTGGLVRAYTKSAKDALDLAGISVVRQWNEINVGCSYGQFERVQLEIKEFDGAVIEQDYGADVSLTTLIPAERSENFLQRLTEISAGSAKCVVVGEQFLDVPFKK